MNSLWTRLTSSANLEISQRQQERLAFYLDLLLTANQTMNLTRVTDRADAEVRHIADSFTLLAHLPKTPHQIADVGSGGGVPGIPLAIMRPDCQVLLIESTQKKAAFLSEAVQKLELPRVRVSSGRAEMLGRTTGRERFDIVVARAVATLGPLAEMCLPLVKKGGSFLAMKGPRVVDELPAAKAVLSRIGGAEPITHAVSLATDENDDPTRHVIIQIRKIGHSPLPPRPRTSRHRPMQSRQRRGANE